jgi:hypothetical protein
MKNENFTAVEARWAAPLGRAWHQAQWHELASNLVPELLCMWQLWAIRMQQAGVTGAEAAATKAVAIGPHRASTTTTAIARANWRLAPAMLTLESLTEG